LPRNISRLKVGKVICDRSAIKGWEMVLRRAVAWFGVLFVASVVSAFAVVTALADASDTEGKTTLEQRIVPTGSGAYRFLQLGAGEPYTVRQDLAPAGAERVAKRTSLVYFGQLSDFQLADEESPARVEVIDPLSTPLNLPFGAAWRPWEALEPQIDEAMIRQVNGFAGASPVADGSGGHRAMDFTIDTGDSADSQQRNETLWVRTLLEGGNLNPNSGVSKTTYSHPLCPKPLRPRRRRGGPLHRRPGLQRLPRGPLPRVLRSQCAGRPALRLAEIPGPDGPRPAGLQRQRGESPLLRRLRQP
jgi:hypothetical protein